MFSNDKNIETFTQLIEMLKHNIELRTQYVKLDVVDKVVRLFSAATLSLLLFVIFLGFMLFASTAAAIWLSSSIGLTQAFLVVAGFYAVLLLIVFLMRKSWIERPLVRFLAGLLMS